MIDVRSDAPQYTCDKFTLMNGTSVFPGLICEDLVLVPCCAMKSLTDGTQVCIKNESCKDNSVKFDNSLNYVHCGLELYELTIHIEEGTHLTNVTVLPYYVMLVDDFDDV